MHLRERPLEVRFWEKVNKTDSCWLWTANVNILGYGLFHVYIDGKWHYRRAHRVAYELKFGKLQDNIKLHHKCKNTRCVNPDHLEPLTQTDHMNLHRRNGRFAEL